MSLVIRNVSVLGATPTDVVIDGERISNIGPANSLTADETIDGTGLVLLPGLVDLHTHLREPGREDAEKIGRAHV